MGLFSKLFGPSDIQRQLEALWEEIGDTILVLIDKCRSRLKDTAMARMARVVVPGYPHHVTQRGVRSIAIFRDDDDRQEGEAKIMYTGIRVGEGVRS